MESNVIWYTGYKQKIKSQYSCRFYKKKPPTVITMVGSEGPMTFDVNSQLEINEIEVDRVTGIVERIFNHNFEEFIDSFHYRNGKELIMIIVGDVLHIPSNLIHEGAAT